MSTEHPETPPTAEQWRLIQVLTLLSMLAWMDKNIFALMVIPITQTFAINDFQLSLLIGTTFAVGNLLAMIPAGYLADVFDRRRVIFAGVSLWSVMVMACGVSAGYWHLFAARVLVGFGEGLLPPAAYSLLRDGVAPERRGRGLSIYAMGQMLGGASAMLAGGALIGVIGRVGLQHLPGLGHLEPFQLTLLLVGAIGLPLGALVFTLREPARGLAAQPGSAGYGAMVRHMAEHRGLYLPLGGLIVAMGLLSAGYGAWLPTMLSRSWGLTPAEIGLRYGAMMLTFPIAGLWLTGTLIDRLARRGRLGVLYFALAAGASTWTCAVALPLAPTVSVMWTLMALQLFVSMALAPIMPFLVSQTAPPAQTGKIIALFLLVQGLFAYATGPTIVALVAERLFGGGRDAIAHALSTVNAAYGVVGVCCVALIIAHLRRRRAEAA